MSTDAVESYLTPPPGFVGEWRVTCPFCGPTHRNSKSKCIAVNAATGLWTCHRCRETGRLHDNRGHSTHVLEPNPRTPPERAAAIWNQALPAPCSHPYLRRKHLPCAFGARIWRGLLVIPLRDIDRELVGLQFIQGSGEKRMLRGTLARGAMHVIGLLGTDERIAIGEGYATAASVRLLSRQQVTAVCAFSAGNLVHVARALRDRYADVELFICGDRDRPGLLGAARAAREARAGRWLPREGFGDFNDQLVATHGSPAL